MVTPETAPVIIDSDNHQVFFAQLVNEWQGLPYSELAVLLAWTKALATIHQTHHWEASGDPFYGDHLLYERLYNGVSAEVDTVAEKAVGMSTAGLVCPYKQTEQMIKILKVAYFERPGIPQSSDLADRSLHVEYCFQKVLKCVTASLEARGELTPGVDNMLADIADKHEQHCYLLKQRKGC